MRHQHGRPDYGMKNDVVFPYEVDETSLGVAPVPAPELRLILLLRPFHGRGDVADGSVKPHVENFTGRALERHGNAPVDIACDRTVCQAFAEPAGRELSDVALPMLLGGLPFLKRLLELRQPEEPVPGLAHFRRCAADLAARIYKLFRLQPAAAGFAQIPSGPRAMAVRAFSFNVTIGEKPAAGRAI